jgi:putative transposase
VKKVCAAQALAAPLPDVRPEEVLDAVGETVITSFAALPSDVRPEEMLDAAGGTAIASFAALPPDVRKVSDFPGTMPLYFRGCAPLSAMVTVKFRISKDTPSLYLTAVAKDRLPVFQTEAIKRVTCQAMDEARASCGFLLFAYVIMPDHLHLLTDSLRPPSEVLRFIKGTIAHRVIEYLKEKGYESSLRKLRHAEWKRHHRHSLWGHESNVFSVFSESMLMQKVNYVHLNPVRAGLIETALDYRWSSARFWQRCERDDEPLRVDLDRLAWRKPSGGA